VVLPVRRQILFNPGPVNLDPAIMANLFNMELCHRQPEFDALASSVKGRLLSLLGFSDDEFRVSILHGSGTLAVDAGLTSLVRGRVLVVDNGLYSRRFLRTLEDVDGVECIHHDLGIGRAIDADLLTAEARRIRPDWLAVVHHETTTGLLNPLEDIALLRDEVGCRLFVDAVSSLGAHPVDARADVVCFNSSKCLESLPGIAGVIYRHDLKTHPTVPVLDVAAYVDSMPNTPNVQAFVALDVALELLAGEDRPARYERLARHVWDVGSRHFEPLLVEEQRSHVLTSFRLGRRSIDELFARALSNRMVIYPGQMSLRDEIFRVANMGAAIDERAIDELFEVLAP
jgi:2-aminoethylphosphonate-pyruvate transaminase